MESNVSVTHYLFVILVQYYNKDLIRFFIIFI